MHATIFQISTEPIAKDDYITENTTLDVDVYGFDYIADIAEENRYAEIRDLVEKRLPKGMFTLIGKDTIRYNGGIDKWKEEFVGGLMERAGKVNEENCMRWIGEPYQLQEYLVNPLGIYSVFHNEWMWGMTAQLSKEFMCFVNTLKPGTLLYIGGILDYHF